MCFSVTMWKQKYDEHLCDQNIEIELRVGKQTSSGFKSDVGKDFYCSVLRQLENNNWDNIDIQETEYIIFKSGVRKTGQRCIQKENLYKSNQKFGKFDIRFAINIEEPVSKEQGAIVTIRKKYRKSFSKQFYRFDVTHIKNDDTYEIEMEIIDINYAKKHSYDFIFGNMMKLLLNLLSSSNFQWSA